VLTTIASSLDPARFEVHLAVLAGSRQSEAPFPSSVKIDNFGQKQLRYAFPSLLRAFWKLRPHVAVSAGGPSGILALIAARLASRQTRLIVRQGTMSKNSVATENAWRTRIYGWSLRHADQVICQAEAMARDVIQAFGVPSRKIHVLYNPVFTPNVATRKRMTTSAPGFLVVSRLAAEKRIDLVIRAFAIAKKHHNRATLTIVGDGPCRRTLEELAEREAMEGIVFAGYQRDPAVWMKNSDLLVMASRYEGLPNVALEAVSLGLPVVALACPGGLAEIAETTDTITLVRDDDAQSLAAAMIKTVADRRASEAVSKTFWTRFGLHQVLEEYERVLAS